MSGHCIIEMFDVDDDKPRDKDIRPRAAWSEYQIYPQTDVGMAPTPSPSSPKNATLAKREQGRKTTADFLEKQMLHQVKQLFKQACGLREQCWAYDSKEQEASRGICQLERIIRDIRDLELDRRNFDKQLSDRSKQFMDLNATAIAACMRLRASNGIRR